MKSSLGHSSQSHAFHALNKSAYIANTNKSVLEGRRATSTNVTSGPSVKTSGPSTTANAHTTGTTATVGMRTGASSVGAAQMASSSLTG